MEPLIGQGQAAPQQHVKDSDTDNFIADVIEASQQAPVIVDFWAPWCGPCKQLGPMLEKTVNQARGAVSLVKINVDENQRLAAQLQIQSIPAVMAFSQGRPVDGFVGALPESQIKEFVSRLAGGAGGPTTEDMLAAARQALESGDTRSAGAIFQQVLAEEPENSVAIAGLARCLLADGNVDAARQVLDQAPNTPAEHAEITAVRNALALAEETANTEDPAALARRLEANPDDHDARFGLAMALFARGSREDAVEHLLELIRRDREWNEEAARKQLLKLFDAMGPTDPLTVKGRRRLSSLLFA